MTTPTIVLVQHVHLATTSRPSAGASALAAAALYVAVTIAGLLAAPVLTGAASHRRLRLALAAVLLGGEFVISREDGVAADIFVAIHLVAAAIWAGGVLYLALLARNARGRAILGGAIRRLSPYAIASAVTLVASGYFLLRVQHLGVWSLGDSGYGQIVLVKSVLLAMAAALGVAHSQVRRRRTLAQRSLLVRSEAGVLAGALGLAGVLLGTAAPLPVVQFAAPGLAVVRIPNAPSEALFVTSLSSDVGAVRVLSSEGVRLVDRATDQAHQLGPGQAARVELHGGVARLALTSGLATVRVSLRAESPARPPADGDVTADPVSWLDYQLGRMLGVAAGGREGQLATPRCVAPTPWHEGLSLGTTLRHRHTPRVAVYTDSSSRAVALVGGLERGGVHAARLPHARVALIATDAMRARSLLARLADRPWIRAVYLAPWLLDGRVLSLLATTRLPPLLVASPVDAMSPLADRYRAALGTVADGVPPSVAGFVGYADSVAPTQAGSNRLTLYSAAPIGFLPGVVDVGHDHGSDTGWFAGGSLVPTAAAALRTASPCPVT